jgi:hypothetical protein
MGILALAASAAGEVVTVGTVTVHSVDEVPRYCHQRAGDTCLAFPGTRSWTLMSSDKQYHPMPLDFVIDAVRSVGYPLDGMEIDVVVLPAPRREIPKSTAEGSVIFLSPGRNPYQAAHVHYVVAHEIGHVVQHTLMPRSRSDLWQQYADTRGLVLSESSWSGSHCERIVEIFAEDFRVLFGGDLARFGGEVENHDLVPPEQVTGLRDFMLSLLDAWTANLRMEVSPNPFESTVTLRSFGSAGERRPEEVVVVDVQGRRLRTLGTLAGSGSLVWDGRDDRGRAVSQGVYFIAVGSGPDRCVFKVLRTVR